MALIVGGPGLGTLRTGAVMPPSKALVPAKSAAPKKTGSGPVYNSAATKTVQQQPPPAAPNYATLMAQASSQASKLAAAQIAAQVKAITDQQAADRATAAQQAAEINKASLAAAQFLGGLGDMAKSDYSAAVQNLGGMAGGFTGALRDTAQQAADAAQAQLASIPGNEQQVVNRGNDLANLVYGVSGQIPANALATQGLGATELARAIPAQTIGYGQQQALGVIGAGNKDAAALNAQIAQIRATLPSTTSTYLSQFEKSAQDAVTNARQARLDALNAKNIGSQIATRKATLAEKKKQDKAAAKADALKNAPRPDKSASADGYLRDQYGHLWTVTKGGVKYAQPAPGFHFDRTGRPVADPKPTSPAQVAAALARYASTYHYRTDLEGDPLLTAPNAQGVRTVQPIAPYVLDPSDPTGRTVMPRPKPTPPAKPFMPKPIKLGDGTLGYVGQDGQIHSFYQADGKTPVPAPTTQATPKLFNAGGYWATIGDDGQPHLLHDDNGTPLLAGTPKTPPATHFSGRYPGADGFWHVYNSTTGEDKTLPTRVPPKVAAAGSWQKIVDPKTGQITFYNPTTQVTQSTPFKGAVPGQSAGTWTSYLGPNGNRWRINNKTNAKIDTGQKWRTPASGGETPLTTTQKQEHTSRLDTALDRMQHGWVGKDPATGEDKQYGPYTRAEAIDEMIKEGYFSSPQMKRLAMKLLNKYFPKPGTVVSRLPPGPAALGTIPRIPSDIVGGPPGAYAIP